MNHKSNNNLKSWQPGQSGNPKGRPVGTVSVVTKIKQRIREHPEEADSIVDALFTAAKNGSSKHLEIILERIDGKIPDVNVQIKLIRTEIVHKLGIALASAILQAGISKEQGREVVDNMRRLLIAADLLKLTVGAPVSNAPF